MSLWTEHKFAAFVSYSTKDGQVGSRFQKELERYKLPKPLRGRETVYGPVPRRLSPIFRDRSDLSAGTDLTQLIEDGLRDSAWLIVLCSPRSAASPWVNSEITKFLEWGRGHRIIAVLVDGRPSKYDALKNPEGAFPPALLQAYHKPGGESETPPEPFAPGLREPDADGSGGDGFELALLKTVARMTGLPLIEVTQRQGEADRAEKRLYLSLAVGGLSLAAAALISASFAVRQRNEALRTESRILAGRASEMTERNWPDRGIYTALHGLPVGEGLLPILTRPMEPSALARLSEALSRLGHRKRVLVRNEVNDIEEARFLSDEKSILIRCKEYVARYDLGSASMQMLMDRAPHYMALFPDQQSILVTDEKGLAYRISLADRKATRLFQVMGGPIWSLNISPAGDRIVAGLYDHTAHIWDAANGKELHVLRGHETSVSVAKFSPDGKLVLTIAADRTARVWDVGTGAERSVLRQKEDNFGAGEFSKNGVLLATPVSNREILLWDVASGELLRRLQGHTGDISDVRFSPDDSRLASGSHDGTVRIWDTATGAELAQLSTDDYVRSVDFSPDGQRIVGASDGGKVRIYDAVDGTEIVEINTIPNIHVRSATTAAFSPKGTHIMSVSSRDIQIIDPRAGTANFTLRADSGPATAVAFSPDGKNVVAGYESFNAILWDLASGTRKLELGKEAGSIFSVQYSNSGDYFVAGSWDHRVRVWNAASGALMSILGDDEHQLKTFAISPSDQWIATAGEEVVQIWEARSGKMMAALEGHEAEIEGIAFAPESDRLVSTSNDGMARIWDLTTNREIRNFRDPGKLFRSVTFAPSGDRVVTGGDDGVARIWDAGNGQEIHTLRGHQSQIHRVAFSPDGQRILTMSYDNTARLWEGRSARAIAELRAQAGEIVVGSFSADSTRVVTTAHFGNGIAHVWDALSGAPITRLRGHRASVDEVVFSPDGRLIASASTDGTVRIWSAPQGMDRPKELLAQGCRSLHQYQRTFDAEEVADLGLPRAPDGETPCDRAGILSPRWWSRLFSGFYGAWGEV